MKTIVMKKIHLMNDQNESEIEEMLIKKSEMCDKHELKGQKS